MVNSNPILHTVWPFPMIYLPASVFAKY